MRAIQATAVLLIAALAGAAAAAAAVAPILPGDPRFAGCDEAVDGVALQGDDAAALNAATVSPVRRATTGLRAVAETICCAATTERT